MLLSKIKYVNQKLKVSNVTSHQRPRLLRYLQSWRNMPPPYLKSLNPTKVSMHHEVKLRFYNNLLWTSTLHSLIALLIFNWPIYVLSHLKKRSVPTLEISFFWIEPWSVIIILIVLFWRRFYCYSCYDSYCFFPSIFNLVIWFVIVLLFQGYRRVT